MEQTRDVREQRLASAERRLETANNALQAAHIASRQHRDHTRIVQRAQELVVSIEQEVALLQNSVARDYAASDVTRTE